MVDGVVALRERMSKLHKGCLINQILINLLNQILIKQSRQ